MGGTAPARIQGRAGFIWMLGDRCSLRLDLARVAAFQPSSVGCSSHVRATWAFVTVLGSGFLRDRDVSVGMSYSASRVRNSGSSQA